jgi:predicted transcriptional regulator
MIRIGSPEDLHHALCDLRAATRISQTTLAQMLNVGVKRIGDFEHGRRTPSTGTVIRILEAFGFQLALVPLEDDE